MSYTMKDLQEKVGRTPQQIRKILKKEPFVSMTDHINKNENTNRVLYDEIILEKLLEYFGKTKLTEATNEKLEAVENGVGIGETENEGRENTETDPLPPQNRPLQSSDTEKLIKVLEEQLDLERKRNADLEKQLHDKDAERIAILTELMKTQQHLRLMAPARRSIKQWFSDTFRKKDRGPQDTDGGGGQ